MKISSEIQTQASYISDISGLTIHELEPEALRAAGENALQNAPGASPQAIAAIQKNLSSLHLSPDPRFSTLRKACAKKYDLSEKFFCFGNGSDELIDLLSRSYCAPGDLALSSQASAAIYKLRVRASRAEIIELPLTQKYSVDLPAFSEWLQYHPQKERARLAFIANPNAVTGTYFNQKQIENFLKEMRAFANVLVILDEGDEAFVRAEDFPDSVQLLKENKNLVVIKSFSKTYGLAGLPLGVMMAHPEVCEVINRMRLPYNINHLVEGAVTAAFNDVEYVQQSRQLVWNGLDYFYHELAKMGLRYLPSQANFVLFDSGINAERISQKLLKEGVALYPLTDYQLPRHLRLSVGSMHENQAAIQALKKVLALESVDQEPFRDQAPDQLNNHQSIMPMAITPTFGGSDLNFKGLQ